MTIAAAIRQFLEYLELERGRSRLTIRDYDHYLRVFARFADEQHLTEPAQITQELVRLYRLWLNRPQRHAGRGGWLERSKKTQNYYLIALRGYLRWLAARDVASLAPEKVGLARVTERQISFLEPAEIERIIAAVDPVGHSGGRDAAILELLFSTGLRISELISLNRDDINVQTGEFAIQGKGGKVRVVFISEPAKIVLQRYLKSRNDTDPALFVRTRDNQYGQTTASQRPKAESEVAAGSAKPTTKSRRLSPRSIQRLVGVYAAAAGLAKKVTPHVFRHSFATDLLHNGADLRSVQELLGHASVTTTQVYTHVTNPQLRDVHAAFHARLRPSRAETQADTAPAGTETRPPAAADVRHRPTGG